MREVDGQETLQVFVTIAIASDSVDTKFYSPYQKIGAIGKPAHSM